MTLHTNVPGLRGFDCELRPLWHDDQLDAALHDLEARMEADPAIDDYRVRELLDAATAIGVTESPDLCDELVQIMGRLIERGRHRRALLEGAGFTDELRG